MSFYDQFTEEEQALLRQRAERAALSSSDTPEVLASIDTLAVNLGDESYGLPLRSLTAAYQAMMPVIPVPCTPPYVAGITNIRGRVVPVIDLAVLLGTSGPPVSDLTAIVVVANDTITLAFRVSAIGDTILVGVGELTPVSGLFELAKRSYVQGVLPDGTIMLNIDAVLNDPALIVDATA